MATIGVIVSFFFGEYQVRTAYMQNARAHAYDEAALLRSQLEGQLNADIQLVQGLIAILQLSPNMSQKQFSALAENVVGDKKEFINIAVAPDLVVKMVYPYEANKYVLGLDYAQHEAQRGAVQRVKDSGQFVMAGPVDLVQGGQGFIGRFPIFVPDGVEQKFWGITSAVLDINALYEASGLTRPDAEIDIALKGADGTGADGDLFYGDAAFFENDPVLLDVVLPVGTWQLAAVPVGGWPHHPHIVVWLRLVMFIAAALIIVPTFLACDLSQRRQNTITMLRIREAELKAKQLELVQLSTVAKNASDSIILTDPHSNIIWTNDAFTMMTGYTAEHALGKNPGELLNGPKTDPNTINDIIDHQARGETFRTQILNYTQAKEEIWVDTHLVPVRDEAGNVTMVVGIERDITQAKTYELELAAAKLAAEQSEKAKSEFLANMSHEIRTPMNGIVGMADILAETKLTDADKQCVDSIRQSSQALLAIINDILDMSRLEAGKLSLADVNFDLRSCVDAVVDVVTPAARDKGLSISVEYQDDVPTSVRADSGRLRQILLNLLGNAVKFTDVGHLNIRVGHARDDRHRLTFAVQDTGIGLDETEVASIFDRFSQADGARTRAFGGAGLGLAISRHLAELMGGGVDVTSRSGQGSCFTLTIQCRPPTAPIEDSSTAQELDFSMLQGCRVLVADDNRTNRLLIQKYLSEFDVEIVEAENGQVALDKCLGFRPHVILMDMSMPEMDGLSAAKAIRELPIPRPSIIAITANAFSSDRKACLDAGMDDFLAKPVKKQDLIAGIISSLGA